MRHQSLLTLGVNLDTMLTMSRVVIIGAGQDASYMADYLLANTDHEVVIATRRTSSDRLDNLSQALTHSRARLATVDLNDAHSITSLVQAEVPAYLINLGGSTFVPDSFNAPAQVMTTNAIALIHILEAVRQFAPECRVFSAGSSTEAEVKSVYAVSKLAAGALCRVYRETYGLYVVHGVLHNHASPRQSEMFLPRKVAKGVARIARAIKDGRAFEPIELGNLDAQIDVSWAPDFVDGIWRMLHQESLNPALRPLDISELGSSMGGPYEILDPPPYDYTLSSDSLYSVRHLVERAFGAAGIDAFWIGQGMAEGYAHEHGYSTCGIVGADLFVRINPAFYRLTQVLQPGDSSAARRELGWTPAVSFDELIGRMVRAELAAQGLA